MFSFPPERRLHNSREYAKVWREGHKYHTEHLLVIVAPATRADSRLGITVSRKVGNSVCRNRLKRWTREYFRHLPAGSLPKVDINVVAKRQAGSLSHDEFSQELRSAFVRLEADGHA